jgi:hypothetical protein
MKRLVILLLAIVAHLSATAQVITISSDFFKTEGFWLALHSILAR